MAIVTRNAPIVKKWEEFVTIKLSKREAAGLLCLMSSSPANEIVPFDLFSELDDAVGGGCNYGDIRINDKDSDKAGKFLDTTYGSL